MTACPNEPVLARAISEGEDPDLAAHLAACASCRDSWNGMANAIELARRVVVRMPQADRREEMRTAILAKSALRSPAAPAQRSRSVRWWFAGAVLAAAAAAVVVLATHPHEAAAIAHGHGTVHGHDGARYAVSSSIPDEIVTLYEGVIDVEVTPLRAGERFRVITADTEVEVRGTAFEVTAHQGHVTGVSVRHGLVEVRPLGGAIAMVGTGQSWTAPDLRTASATPPVEPAPPPRAVPSVEIAPPTAPAPPRAASRPRSAPAAITERVEPAPAPLAPPRAPQAIAYDEAWAAMRSGDFAKASTTFARAGILDPDGALAEDASYWYPVALARAKRPEAVTAFREFLDRYPRSTHAREASAMLGWLLVDANQRDEAERRFRAAADDPNPEVSGSARAGLAALGKPTR
jgi:TolA-binding protein